ncbi:MAG: hypothetical protein SGILL_006168 [Bacillariaceae sp.]
MSEFDDSWLDENPTDSPIGGRGSNIEEDGLRLATSSPLYKGPASLQVDNNINNSQPNDDPYTITVDDEDPDPESPREPSDDNVKKTAGDNNNNNGDGSNPQRRRNILIGSICILIIVIICIIVGVVVSKNKNKDDGATPQPAADPTNNSTNNNTGNNNTGNQTVVDTEDSYILPYLGSREGIVTYSSKSGPFQVEIPTLASDMSAGAAIYNDESEFQDGLSRSALFLINNVAGRLLGWPGYANAGYGNGGFVGVVDVPVADVDVPGGNEEIAADVPTTGSIENVDSFQTNNQEMNLDEADVSKSDGTYIYAAYGNSLLVFSANSNDLLLNLQMPPAQCDNPAEPPVVEPPVAEPPVEPEVDVNTTNTGPPTSPPGNSSGPDLGTAELVEGDEDILFIPEPGFSCPQVLIQSILLDTNHSTLALVVSGYGIELREKAGIETPVLTDVLSTQVRLYSTKPLINNGAGISLLAVKNLSGYYKQGYVMENGISHIVTSSGVNTQDWLVTPIESLKNQKAVRNATSDEDAFEKSVRMARPEIVDAFVNQTVKELSAITGNLPRIAPLRLPVVNESGVDGFENVLLGSGYANNVIQITSFDMREEIMIAENSTEGEITVSQTVQFVENAWGEVYAADTMLINTAVAYSFVGDAEEDMTILHAYGVDNMTTTPFATGKVPGRLLNRYALDYHAGLFRVATTTRTWAANDFFVDVVSSEEVGIRNLQEINTGALISVETCPSVTDADECFTTDTISMCSNMTARGCTSIVYFNETCPFQLICMDDLQRSQCPLPVSDGANPCLNGANLAECLALEESGCENIAIMESCPLQFSCGEEPDEEEFDITPASTTKNRIFVLERPSEAMPEMAIVGNATMGKPNESFTAVRFFDTVAYAVTFLQTDPFYVVSFEEPKTPVVLGELEVSGFSSYMHSIDTNNTKILTVGTETTAEGQEIGLKISLFDATNRTNPTEVSKFVSENSWSAANWDFRAFRYVKLTEEEGRIIIPVYLFNSTDVGESFDGFVVFSLSPEGISESFRIDHQAADDIFLEGGSCNVCGYLPERSFVIQGNVTTLKGAPGTARSHNLETGELLWSRDFVGEGYCCS